MLLRLVFSGRVLSGRLFPGGPDSLPRSSLKQEKVSCLLSPVVSSRGRAWVARPESSKGVAARDCTHALRIHAQGVPPNRPER